jgi:hypothetical protein
MDKYDNLFDQNEPDKLIRELRGNVIWHWSPNDLSGWRPGEISTAPCRASDRIEKLEAALRALKAMHHAGGIDDLQERDDRTYSMVCEALEGKDD